MELEHLTDFLILAETRHYTEAAERLYISPSCLSRRIQALEKALGKPLFNRTRRRVELSELGVQFYPYAEQIVRLQREFSSKYLDERQRKSRIVLGSSCSLLPYALPQLLRPFIAQNPDILIESLSVNPERQIEALDEGICDFLFTGASQIKTAQYERLVVDKDTVILMVPNEQPLAEQKEAGLEVLANKRVSVISALSGRDSVFLSRCREAGLTLDFVVAKEANMIDAVGINGFILVTLEKAIRAHIGNAFRYTTIIPEIHEDMVLVFRDKASRSQPEERFLSYVKDHIQ